MIHHAFPYEQLRNSPERTSTSWFNTPIMRPLETSIRSEKFQLVPEHWSGKNSRSWPSTGIAMGPCTNAPPYALISGALWLGTTPKKLGIAPATDLASTLTAKFLTVQQTRTSSPWAIKRWRMRVHLSTLIIYLSTVLAGAVKPGHIR
jgi:hypothetical protein